MTSSYPRDIIGYGPHPPDPQWPGGARVAVPFVINGLRHPTMESIYEYGSRAGFWRLSRLFTARGIPVTVYGVAMALERNPAAVEAMLSAGWEIANLIVPPPSGGGR
jgi:peptidoglycan/xylan/chitin deacetylase (PgdA/CDA1 family)